MMLITAVVASAILITAVFPVVWTMVSTFSTASHDTDTRMRTDFKIVTTYALGTSDTGKVWMKNIGSNKIGISDVQSADTFFGPQGNFGRMIRQIPNPVITANPNVGNWSLYLDDTNSNNYWDPGETLEIHAHSSTGFSSGDAVYFQFVLPNSVWRSSEFTSS